MERARPRASRRKLEFRMAAAFLLVNGFLVALAAAVDRLEAAMGPSFLACLAACALRDAAVVLFLDVATAGKARLNDRARPSRSQVKDAWRGCFLVAAPVGAMTLCLARHLGWVGAPRPLPIYASSPRPSPSRSASIWGTTGRTASRTPAPGAAAASRRRSLTPTRRTRPRLGAGARAGLRPGRRSASSSATRYRHWRARGDGWVLDSVTLVWAYKAYVEAAGHAGCESRATSFSPVWLPRHLGIALRTADHDAHHGAAAVNFAATTPLWDRVFGTYAVEPTRPLRAPSFESPSGRGSDFTPRRRRL